MICMLNKIQKFNNACDDIIWSSVDTDGNEIRDTQSTYATLAHNFNWSIKVVKRKFKEQLNYANAQMSLYGYEDDMNPYEIEKEINKINHKIFNQMNHK